MKSSSRDISWTAWKSDEGSSVSPGQCSCTPSVIAMAAVRDRGFELVDHPPYSPDLAPSDYFLFPNMKNIGKNPLGWEAVLDWWWGHYVLLRTFSEDQDERFHRSCTGIQTLQHRWSGRSVWTAGETMLKINKIWANSTNCIIVSLWTFQPTLIALSIWIWFYIMTWNFRAPCFKNLGFVFVLYILISELSDECILCIHFWYLLKLVHSTSGPPCPALYNIS